MIPQLFDTGSYILNFYAVPHLFTAILLITFAGAILLSERGSKLGWLFAFMTVISSFWLLTQSLVMLSGTTVIASLWSHLLFFVVCYIPFSIYLYVASVTGTFEANRRYLFLSFIVSFVLSIFVLFSDRMVLGVHEFWWGYFPRYGRYGLLFLAYHTAVMGCCLYLLWRHWREARTEKRRRRYRMVFLAFASASFAIIDIFAPYGYEVFPAGFLPVVGFCTVLSFAIVRYRTTDFSPAYAAKEMMATMDDPLIVCDLDGMIQFVNERCEEVFDFPEEDLVQTDFQTLLASRELGSGKVSALRQGNIPDDEEFVFRTRDNDEIDVKLSVSRLTDSENRPVGIVIIARDIRELKRTEEQIEELELKNSVTNLPNRQYLFEKYSDSAKSSRFEDTAVLHLGFPNFDEIEHSIGPHDAEVLLEMLSERLQGIPLDSAELISWSEHEFVLIDFDVPTPEKARELAEEWLSTLNEPLEVESRTFTLRANVGIALGPEHGTDVEKLLTRADLARDEVRKEPGKTIRVYEKGIQEKTNERISVKSNLRRAVNNQELDLVYHPILPADPERCPHVEALLRWNDRDHGAVSPPRIIDMAEELDLMSNLGHWIIERGCRDLARLNDACEPTCKLSLNLSASQVHERSHLLDSIDEQIEKNGIPPENLTLEITETTAMEDLNFSRGLLSSIKERGCRVAVDDFGTGHSSIQYLMDLPIDILKIDKSFILNLFEQSQNKILVETMLFMAHQLDLEVVAEGIETGEHRDFLVNNGCNYLQGFLWTEPLDLDSCIDFFRNHPNPIRD